MVTSTDSHVLTPSARHTWSWVNPPFNTTGSTGDQTKKLLIKHSWTRTVGGNYPNWRVRLASGITATTTLSGYKVQMKLGYADAHWWTPNWNPGHAESSGNLIHGPLIFTDFTPDPSLDALAKSDAATKFAKKVRSKTRNWQGGVFLAELGKTARMLHSPVRTLFNAVGELEQRLLNPNYYFRSGGSTVQQIGEVVRDVYLEWVYGISPTINDLEDASNAFNALANGRKTHDNLRLTAESSAEKATVSTQFIAAPFSGGVPGPSGVIWDYNGTAHYSTSEASMCIYRGALKSSNPAGDMPVLQTFGLSLSDILPTVWEEVPWSFLLDYFGNVNDVLDVWSMRFIDFAWLNRTVRNRKTVRLLGFYPEEPKARFNMLSPPATRVSKVDRKPISNTQFECGFYTKVPGIGSRKWLNTAALASSISKGESEWYKMRKKLRRFSL